MWALWLIACDSPDKGAPETGETAETGEAPDVLEPWGAANGEPGEALGSRVHAGGDLDGDGDEELLVSAYLGNRLCALYPPLAPGELAISARETGCLNGEAGFDYAGFGLGAAGDLDGDGYGDLMVGSPGHSAAGANSGKAYLVLGPVTAGSAGLGDAAVASWSGENLLDYVGITVLAVGDLSGDGEVDLAVGAPGFDGEGGGGGRAWIFEGPLLSGEQDLDLSFASVTGLSSSAEGPPPPHGALGTGDFVGDAIPGEADYDGDGAADLALGATGDGTLGPETGKVAFFFGPLDPGDALVSDADSTLYGPAAASYTGSPVVVAPDLDGDGLPELLVSSDGLEAGRVTIARPSRGVTGSLDEADTWLEGGAEGDLFGFGVATPRDLDGDGVLDLVIGSPQADGQEPDAGAATIFFGPFGAGVIGVGEGETLLGEQDYDTFGAALETLSDGDGDGDPDIVVGARDSDAGGSFSGRLYFFGI